MVTKTSEESTIPCVVTNPNINVTLYEWDTNLPVRGLYDPNEGFRAVLEDRTYICRGELKGEVKESQGFNVLSIAGKRLAERGSIRETARSPCVRLLNSQKPQTFAPFNSHAAYA